MKKGILNNLGLKVVTVLMAIAMWFFVTYRGQTEMSIDTPICFKNIPGGLELLRENVKSVSLNIRGHEKLLKSLKPMDIGVIVDLSNGKKGEVTYYIDKDSIVAPRAVEVLRVEPASVRVTLDESASKVVPVKASLIGKPETGYRVASMSVSPSSVMIEGAKTELARIAVLRTEPIDITDLDTNIVQNVKINTGGRNIRPKKSEVTLNVVIKKVGG